MASTSAERVLEDAASAAIGPRLMKPRPVLGGRDAGALRREIAEVLEGCFGADNEIVALDGGDDLVLFLLMLG